MKLFTNFTYFSLPQEISYSRPWDRLQQILCYVTLRLKYTLMNKIHFYFIVMFTQVKIKNSDSIKNVELNFVIILFYK